MQEPGLQEILALLLVPKGTLQPLIWEKAGESVKRGKEVEAVY